MSDLDVTVRTRDGAAVVDLVGDVNAGAERALDQAWAATDGARSVVLNFERADYINSTGIALIVGLLARARASGIALRAYGLSNHYREIFEITRLADFITITDSEEAAVHAPEGRT